MTTSTGVPSSAAKAERKTKTKPAAAGSTMPAPEVPDARAEEVEQLATAPKRNAAAPDAADSPDQSPAADSTGAASGVQASGADPSPIPNRYTEAEWRAMVAEAAYLRAQRRAFVGGSPEQDWLEAEEELRRTLGDRG